MVAENKMDADKRLEMLLDQMETICGERYVVRGFSAYTREGEYVGQLDECPTCGGAKLQDEPCCACNPAI